MYKTDLSRPYGKSVESRKEDQLILSRFSRLLFLVFVTYLVLPIFDIPLLGLSMSAPILFLIFLDIISKPFPDTPKNYIMWFAIGYILWVGLLLSLVGNYIFRSTPASQTDIITLIRFAYWLIAFYTTAVVIGSMKNLTVLMPVLGISILVLGGLRLYEAIFFNRWGAGTSPVLLTQNSYGFQFSTFSPFVLSLPLTLKGGKRAISYIAVLLLVLAIAGNGSRSSWITTTSSTISLIAIYFFSNRNKSILAIIRIIFILLISIILLTQLPQTLLDPIMSRFKTFDTLDTDKSFMIRQLMIQKGIRLFEDSPIFGTGIGRFRQSSVPLDIPDGLRYADQSHFDVKSAHNSYIAFLSETGLVGIIPFLVLHLILVFRGLPATITLANRGEVWSIAVFSGYIGMSIHLWSLSGITSTSPWFIYGMVAGIIIRATKYRDKEIAS